MSCDMCGKNPEELIILVEGVEMNACSKCKSFGKLVRRISKGPPVFKSKEIRRKVDVIPTIKADYSKLIKNKRESLGLSQEDFAKKINEKSSIISKLETGNVEPDINIADKIKKIFRIDLIEESEKIEPVKVHQKSEEFTLGDFVKVRKR